MPAEEPRQSLPFEPARHKQRKSKDKKSPPIVKPDSSSAAPLEQGSGYIPEVVSQRMIKRVVIFCGIPAVMGMLVFIASYVVVSQHLFKIPNAVVLLTSMGCLGLSVLGLSYGILSASWEEDTSTKGSFWGWSEFKINFGRMAQVYRNSKKMRSAKID
jgi:Photosynthesis affected mutant 68